MTRKLIIAGHASDSSLVVLAKLASTSAAPG